MSTYLKFLQVGSLFFLVAALLVILYNVLVIKFHLLDRDQDREFIHDLITLNQKLRDEISVLRLKIRNWEKGGK